MSILCDHQLLKLCQEVGVIHPFESRFIQAASIDLRLGDKFRVPIEGHHTHIDLADVPDFTAELRADSFVLHPGEFVLGTTFERIRVPDTMVGRMEGKSSLGRLGLIVHVTAGFFDPGFQGHGTLEFVNLLRLPIVLRAGLPICQFSFQWLSGMPDHPYQGRYQGDDGPSASRYGKGPPE